MTGGTASGPERFRVLVVEDNEMLLATMAIMLEQWSYVVETASNGPAALELASRFRPDLVLLDIGLPGMDGYEVARQIRRQPNNVSTAIVALTGYAQEDLRRQSEAASFQGHLVKPIDPNELQSLLGKIAAQSPPRG